MSMQIIMSDNLSIVTQGISCMKKYRKTKLDIEGIQADGAIHGKEYLI